MGLPARRRAMASHACGVAILRALAGMTGLDGVLVRSKVLFAADFWVGSAGFSHVSSLQGACMCWACIGELCVCAKEDRKGTHTHTCTLIAS